MASTNMLLPVPIVGVTLGPQYATDNNNCLNLIDVHDHSSGKGVQITPDGININQDLTLNSNNLIGIRTSRFDSQSAVLAGSSDLNVVYTVGADLYYNDGAGNQIAITNGGSIAAAAGNITNLVSPAYVSFDVISSTFVFGSTATLSANIDASSYKMRNISPNSTYALTLQAPTLSADYTLTMPAIPASKKIVTINTSGNINADYDTDNTTLEVSSNNLRIKALGVGTNELATSSVTAAKMAANAISNVNVSASAAIDYSKLGVTNGAGGTVAAGSTGVSGNVLSSQTISFGGKANAKYLFIVQGATTPTGQGFTSGDLANYFQVNVNGLGFYPFNNGGSGPSGRNFTVYGVANGLGNAIVSITVAIVTPATTATWSEFQWFAVEL